MRFTKHTRTGQAKYTEEKSRPKVVKAILRYLQNKDIFWNSDYREPTFPKKLHYIRDSRGTRVGIRDDDVYALALDGLVEESPTEPIYDAQNKLLGYAPNEKVRCRITPKGVQYLAKLQRTKKHPLDSGLVEKLASLVFLIAGFIFLALPDFTTTGNIIGNSAGTNISFFLSLGLMIIGGVLLFQSFRKRY